MTRKITITINGDITFNTTEKEEEIIKAIDELPPEKDDDDDETYDMLVNMLNDLLLSRIYKEMKNLNDVEIHDVNWD